MEEAGMSMIWAGTNADETKIFALMEVEDPQAAMAFGKREDIAKYVQKAVWTSNHQK